jgi:hypothetical protein
MESVSGCSFGWVTLPGSRFHHSSVQGWKGVYSLDWWSDCNPWLFKMSLSFLKTLIWRSPSCKIECWGQLDDVVYCTEFILPQRHWSEDLPLARLNAKASLMMLYIVPSLSFLKGTGMKISLLQGWMLRAAWWCCILYRIYPSSKALVLRSPSCKIECWGQLDYVVYCSQFILPQRHWYEDLPLAR